MPPPLKVVSMQYDNRLRVSQHQVASGEYSGGFLKKAEFVYYSDSKPKEMDNQVDAVFDRKFEYDFAGRLSRSEFGLYMTQQNTQLNPHMQDVAYDAFSQVTSRETEQWGSAASFGRTYVNGRMAGHSGETLTYDAAGNITYTGVSSNKFQDTVYDAAGRRSSYTERWIITGSSNSSIVSERQLAQSFDGDGRAVLQTESLERISSPASSHSKTRHNVWSSVLNALLSEIETDSYGIRRKTRVFAGGAVIAEHRRNEPTGESADERVVYFHSDPVTGSSQEVRQTGLPNNEIGNLQEFEPLGQSVRTTAPFEEEPGPNPVPVVNDSLFPEWQCTLAQNLGTDFWEIPSHCKQSALEMLALEDVLTRKKEGNASAVSGEVAHARASIHTDAGTTAHQTTSKPVVDESQAGPVQPAFVPSDDGTDGSSELVNANYAGVNDSSVTVRGGGPNAIDMSQTGVRMAEIGTTSIAQGDEEDLKAGYEKARSVVTDKNNESCRSLFKNLDAYGVKTVEDLLDRYVSNGWITIASKFQTMNNKGKIVFSKFSSSDVAATTVWNGENSYINSSGKRVSADHITINRAGAYFNKIHSSGKRVNLLAGSGFYGMNDSEIRAAIILHELLHTINAIERDGSDQNDEGEKSRQNALLVQQMCFGKSAL